MDVSQPKVPKMQVQGERNDAGLWSPPLQRVLTFRLVRVPLVGSSASCNPTSWHSMDPTVAARALQTHSALVANCLKSPGAPVEGTAQQTASEDFVQLVHVLCPLPQCALLTMSTTTPLAKNTEEKRFEVDLPDVAASTVAVPSVVLMYVYGAGLTLPNTHS